MRPFTLHEGELLAVVQAAILCNPGDRIITELKNTVAWVRSGDPKARPDLKLDTQFAKRLIEQKGVQVLWESQKPRRLNRGRARLDLLRRIIER